MVREEIDKDSSNVQAREHMARNLGMSRKSQQKEKQCRAEEKPKLDNARKLRGIHLIDPEDKEFNETLKNARK